MAKTATDKSMQEDLRESAHKIWLAGLGAVSTAGEEGEKLFNRLVKKGEDLEAKGRGKVDEAKGKVEEAWDDVEKTLDDRIAAALHRFGVPTRDEIKELSKRVEELTAKIEKSAKPASKGGSKAKKAS